MRLLRTVAFVAVAGTAAAGGLALAGFEASMVSAPLIEEEVEAPHLASQEDFHIPPPGARPLGDIMSYSVGLAEPGDEPDLSFASEQRRLTRDEVKLLARVVGWPEHTLDQLAEVAWCESRFDPRATNGDVLGLMQVHRMWFHYGGIDIEQWANPIVNLEAALVAYNYDLARGYAPWTQWQCRPGGFIAAADHNPERPDAVAAAEGTAQALDPLDEDATPTATTYAGTPTPDAHADGDATLTPTPTPTGDATTPPPGDDNVDLTPSADPAGTVEPPAPPAPPGDGEDDTDA